MLLDNQQSCKQSTQLRSRQENPDAQNPNETRFSAKRRRAT
jgi:hypothetical protein